MTTHYQKIQALGNRMVSNLETMGVSASFSDGGLTLADKILQIQHFNDGLILYADKSIAQSSDTVNLYALFLKEGIAQSNKAVSFLENNNPIGSRTLIEDEDNFVGDSYEFSSIPTLGEGEYVYLDADHKAYLVKYGDSIELAWESSGGGRGSAYGISKLSFKNGVLYYVASGVSFSNNVSHLDMSVIHPTIANVSIKGSAVTDAKGIATLPYTCTGAGLKIITAESGTFVSEPYPVCDATILDVGTSTTYYNGWTDTGVSPSRDTYTTLHNTTSSSAARYLRINNSTSLVFDDFAIEWDNYLTNDGSYVVFKGTSDIVFALKNVITANSKAKLTVINNVATIYCDNQQIGDTQTINRDANGKFSFRFQISGTGSDIGYGNFRIYPI